MLKREKNIITLWFLSAGVVKNSPSQKLKIYQSQVKRLSPVQANASFLMMDPTDCAAFIPDPQSLAHRNIRLAHAPGFLLKPGIILSDSGMKQQ
ncbi:hypothetical protein MOR33_004026 [Salmonella enterica]|nr:hypothetical protein [Salmonella enterica]